MPIRIRFPIVVVVMRTSHGRQGWPGKLDHRERRGACAESTSDDGNVGAKRLHLIPAQL
jgi:hypothetical protein